MFKRNKFIWFSCLFILFLLQNCFAATLGDWKDTKAYKPRPILFLHGFISNSGSWQTAINSLHKLYSNYQPVGAYLELIDVQDNIGSVDTYSDGRKGWADVLSEKIKQLLDKTKYGSYAAKLNLVSYSMGGLAAREFLTNPKYGSGYVDKLILIGVPNLGSPLIYGPRGLCEVSKFGVMMTPRLFINFCSFRNNLNDFAKLILIPNLEILDAVKDLTPGSDFLNKLNNRAQPSNVQYCGIYGIISHFLNRVFFGSFEGGDGIVSMDSQLGTDYVNFKISPIKIKAFHTAEPIVAVTEGNPLLKLLDSTPPEFTLDDPAANSTTEIYTASISIKGRVFKEYLPADSEIIITGFRQEDGAVLNQINSLLKPSSFWIPNNSDSPVAEFDETIAFPGQGTYKISCQIQNPAGLTSEIKVFWIKVMVVQPNANIIVHAHNPEGKEIGGVTVYDNGTSIGSAGSTPITILSGHHTINVKFNGMTLTQVIDILNGETRELIFTFTRTIIDVVSLMNRNGSFSGSKSGSNPFVDYSNVVVSERLGSNGTPGDLFSWYIDGVGWRTYDYNYDLWDEPPVGWTLSGSCSYVLTSKNFTTNFNGTLLLSGGLPHIPESIYFDCIRYIAQLHLYLEIPTPNSYGFQTWFGGTSDDPVYGDNYVFYYDEYHSTMSLTVNIDSANAFRDVLSASNEYSVPLNLGELNFYSIPY